MKIGLFSDSHLGITKKEIIRMMFKEMATEKPDILINAGDDNGYFHGNEGVRGVAKLLREVFPATPTVHVMGNHDWWAGFGGTSWEKAQRSLKNCFSTYNIHSLDFNGSFFHEGITFFGCGGWYVAPCPCTNDQKFLPRLVKNKDIHNYLLDRANRLVENQLNNIKGVPVFISHFPVINTGNDYKGRFEDFSWSESLGDMLQKEVGVKHFLCGHAHALHQGPLRFESGSDYYTPKYLIIEI